MPMKNANITKRWIFISLVLFVYDSLAILVSYYAALMVRFGSFYDSIPPQYIKAYLSFIFIYIAICTFVFSFFHMYNSVWRYAGDLEIERIIIASLLTSCIHIVGISVLFLRMPITYYLMGAFFQILFLISIRLSSRLFHITHKRYCKKNREDISRVMLIGAGSAGQMILHDMMQARKVTDKVVCIIDDNNNKWHRYMDGIPIVGGRDFILWAVQEYSIDKIFFAIPSATPEQKRDILSICNESGCKLMQLPGIYQFVLGQIGVTSMKRVSLEDLLGREQILTNMDEVFAFLSGRVVMVTGGGGSIGSELCRQIAAHNPKRLIIFDIYENSTYSIQLEIQKKYPDLDLVTLIGSVRDSQRLFQVFRQYRPQIVYHAAAHKHVPLMENSPCEAIKNNTIGTYKTAYAAMLNGCERFVLISTDKAVNPTNIMGASKRLCEMIIQSFDYKIKEGMACDIPGVSLHPNNNRKLACEIDFQKIKTQFVAVRFGNVLGSNGSVIPIFKKQIEDGGPVTVTHPDIIRYFMTIKEAVSLVMLAGVYAQGGEIFVLDMGSPVKIDTLARNLIRLSGYKPDEDIKIVYTGLRPGEKLYEEKLMAEEGLKKTNNNLIYIGCPIPFDKNAFLINIGNLLEASNKNDDDIREHVAKIVKTYRIINKTTS